MSCCADDACADNKTDLKGIELSDDEISEEEFEEEHEDVVKFKSQYETRVKELNSVLELLQSEQIGLEIIQATKYEESVSHFRGVKFHLLVLQHPKEILALIPSFVQDGLLTQLENTNDSLKLGQFMIYVGLVSKAKPHPNLEIEKYSKQWKKCQFVAHDNSVFEIGYMYVIEKKIDQKKSNMYLFLVCAAITALVFQEHWPLWLQDGTYRVIMAYIIAYFFLYFLRILLWVVPYHFGYEFWLLPAYRSAWTPQYYLKAPYSSFEKKKDGLSIGGLVWRSITGATILLSVYQMNIHNMKAVDISNYWSAWLLNALDPAGSWQIEINDGYQEAEISQQQKEMEMDA